MLSFIKSILYNDAYIEINIFYIIFKQINHHPLHFLLHHHLRPRPHLHRLHRHRHHHHLLQLLLRCHHHQLLLHCHHLLPLLRCHLHLLRYHLHLLHCHLPLQFHLRLLLIPILTSLLSFFRVIIIIYFLHQYLLEVH